MFETKSCMTTGNQVKLTIQPEQTIDITLDAKSSGLGFQLETRRLSFTCKKGSAEIKNSYEKVRVAIAGDQMLLTRTDKVFAA